MIKKRFFLTWKKVKGQKTENIICSCAIDTSFSSIRTGVLQFFDKVKHFVLSTHRFV
jgi:hypothetical protein